MVIKYQLNDVFWVTIGPSDGFPAQVDMDVIAVNEKGDSLPSYFIIDNQKLYILLETSIPNAQSKSLFLYFGNKAKNKVLAHDHTDCYPVEPDVYKIFSCINEDAKWKTSTKNIVDVISAIPNFYALPLDIENKFINKYFIQ
nr:hypothetical protein [Abalone asfa-like virus]